MTKIKDMPDANRRLLCRAKSWYRDISRFTAETIIFIKEKFLEVKVEFVVWYQARRVACDIYFCLTSF